MPLPSISRDDTFGQHQGREAYRRSLLHILRNPAGWSEDTVRDARRKAADELERLWSVEGRAASLVGELHDIVAPETRADV